MAERLSSGATPIHRFLFAPVTVKRAVKVSLLIGTLLILINQGDLILAGGAPAIWKVLLTYLVPYGVSSYSTAALLRDTARAGE
ncbi:MAG: nitrate/nitrite transporter NrtS [Pseudomonadota bacterium]